MDDGWWPLYESCLKGELHVISKRYTQRIERHNLNLRNIWQGWAGSHCRSQNRWSCKDKVIGHYLKHKTLSVSWSHYPAWHGEHNLANHHVL